MLTTNELRTRLDAEIPRLVVAELCRLCAERLVAFEIVGGAGGFTVTILTQDGEGEACEARIGDAIYAALDEIDERRVAEVVEPEPDVQF
jgi:hypothetical protein